MRTAYLQDQAARQPKMTKRSTEDRVCVWSSDREVCNAVERLGRRIHERIDDSDFVARLQEYKSSVRSNVAGATRDQDLWRAINSPSVGTQDE
jgi:hypothetical protein